MTRALTSPSSPLETRRGPVTEMIAGFRYPFQAFAFMRKHQLWGLAGAAIAINVVLLLVLLAITFWLVMPQIDALNAALVGIAEQAWLQGLLQALAWVISLVVGILLIAGNALLLLLVGQAVASPFLDLLSEKVESIAMDSPPFPFGTGRLVRGILVALSDIVWSLSYLIAFNLPILVIGWFPVLGQAVAGVLGVVTSALIFAQEFIGLSLVRHFVSYRRRFAQIWKNRWVSLGFGLATMLMFAIPGVNLVLLPVAAAAGTLAYCDLRRAGRLDVAFTSAPTPATR